MLMTAVAIASLLLGWKLGRASLYPPTIKEPKLWQWVARNAKACWELATFVFYLGLLSSPFVLPFWFWSKAAEKPRGPERNFYAIGGLLVPVAFLARLMWDEWSRKRNVIGFRVIEEAATFQFVLPSGDNVFVNSGEFGCDVATSRQLSEDFHQWTVLKARPQGLKRFPALLSYLNARREGIRT